MSDPNQGLPPRGTAREQAPPEQRAQPLKGQEPNRDDLQEGNLGGPQTGSGPAHTPGAPQGPAGEAEGLNRT